MIIRKYVKKYLNASTAVCAPNLVCRRNCVCPHHKAKSDPKPTL
ncbi:Uncharacterised protein [Segatella buccae]|uniref:Uncharacterized protein n=1 Tax=Segatella buccae TaxID=28126 RepID=A0AAQ1ZJY9_9BACT|nr:Uncharacterised protein [Segatella buccae]